ncbi:MAG: hypothetical protein IJ730_02740 [Alphaproteobacteria bacterium]|nr:hypothetical protein [Alphaproteobacteria bacterium]
MKTIIFMFLYCTVNYNVFSMSNELVSYIKESKQEIEQSTVINMFAREMVIHPSSCPTLEDFEKRNLVSMMIQCFKNKFGDDVVEYCKEALEKICYELVTELLQKISKEVKEEKSFKAAENYNIL